MLTTLTVDGFRGLRRFELPELRRVNLLVGRNNGGKTAVLEAAGWLAQGGALGVLDQAARGRGEQAPSAGASLRPLFTGQPRPLRGELRLQGTLHGQAVELLVDATDRTLSVRRSGWGPLEEWAYLPLGPHDGLAEPGGLAPPSASAPPVVWGSAAEDPSVPLTALWERLVGNPAEEVVVQALQLLEPRVRRVVFTPGERTRVFLVLDGVGERVPLSSVGEGMRRLLALGVRLAAGAGGLVLVDELDTGMHHSVLTRLWRVLLQAAERLDAQLIATTHSLDALRALAWLHGEDAQLTRGFLLHTVQKEEERARTFTADEVHLAVDSLLELRG